MVKTVLFESGSITRKVLPELIQKSDPNVFIRIAAVNGLPNFVSPTEPLSHKGEHNTRNTPSHYYLKVPPLRPVFHYIYPHVILY